MEKQECMWKNVHFTSVKVRNFSTLSLTHQSTLLEHTPLHLFWPNHPSISKVTKKVPKTIFGHISNSSLTLDPLPISGVSP